MTPFQLLALVAIALLTALTLRTALRGHMRKRMVVLWLSIWLAAGVAVAWPRSTMVVARALGIGRGTDVMLYLYVVFSMAGFFYVFSRLRRLDRQLTLLARAFAIENALRQPPQRGSNASEGALD